MQVVILQTPKKDLTFVSDNKNEPFRLRTFVCFREALWKDVNILSKSLRSSVCTSGAVSDDFCENFMLPIQILFVTLALIG